MDPSTADQWELCNDDGFIHKRKKRRLDDPPPVQGPDPEAEERQRRERRRKVLLKLKERYQKEIDQWEFLSNTLRAMQEKSHQQQQRQQQRPLDLEETAALLGSASKMVQEDEIGCGSLVDQLLLQAEAQEAIIHDISSLCDVAEAMCSAQEEQLKQSFIDLPVWSSPRELMASLCDE
ncbi:cryptic loci regulator [Citrus sinensis]|uniref:Cryptic loci regulator n=1 Tax=Citrus sinensis TaxID=2711 RepID=A0ACB8MZ76_CITSI|nr:cryptic loci regulator [Citrus sinensis]